jgi:hypothetical protein
MPAALREDQKTHANWHGDTLLRRIASGQF